MASLTTVVLATFILTVIIYTNNVESAKPKRGESGIVSTSNLQEIRRRQEEQRRKIQRELAKKRRGKRAADPLQSFYNFLIDQRLTRLCKLFRQADLEDILPSAGPFTLFAPSNDAFAFLPGKAIETLEQDQDALRRFLMYHIVPGTVPSVNFEDDIVIHSAEGYPLRLNVYQNGEIMTVSGSQILEADLRDDDIVVHVIDHVLYQPPKFDISNQIRDSYNNLYKLLVEADLVDHLANGVYTFFAPSNEAFLALPSTIRDALLTNSSLLNRVISNHVLYGTFFRAGLPIGYSLQPVEGNSLHFTTKRGSILVNRVPIIESDIMCTNGVIHVINRVLLSPDILEDCNCILPIITPSEPATVTPTPEPVITTPSKEKSPEPGIPVDEKPEEEYFPVDDKKPVAPTEASIDEVEFITRPSTTSKPKTTVLPESEREGTATLPQKPDATATTDRYEVTSKDPLSKNVATTTEGYPVTSNNQKINENLIPIIPTLLPSEKPDISIKDSTTIPSTSFDKCDGLNCQDEAKPECPPEGCPFSEKCPDGVNCPAIPEPKPDCPPGDCPPSEECSDGINCPSIQDPKPECPPEGCPSSEECPEGTNCPSIQELDPDSYTTPQPPGTDCLSENCLPVQNSKDCPPGGCSISENCPNGQECTPDEEEKTKLTPEVECPPEGCPENPKCQGEDCPPQEDNAVEDKICLDNNCKSPQNPSNCVGEDCTPLVPCLEGTNCIASESPEKPGELPECAYGENCPTSETNEGSTTVSVKEPTDKTTEPAPTTNLLTTENKLSSTDIPDELSQSSITSTDVQSSTNIATTTSEVTTESNIKSDKPIEKCPPGLCPPFSTVPPFPTSKFPSVKDTSKTSKPPGIVKIPYGPRAPPQVTELSSLSSTSAEPTSTPFLEIQTGATPDSNEREKPESRPQLKPETTDESSNEKPVVSTEVAITTTVETRGPFDLFGVIEGTETETPFVPEPEVTDRPMELSTNKGDKKDEPNSFTDSSDKLTETTEKLDIVTEPSTKSNVVTEPSTKSNDVTELTIKSSDATESTPKSSDATEPFTKSIDVTEPTVKTSDSTEPSSKSSDLTEPATNSSEATEPSSKYSDITESSTKLADVTEPSTKPSDITELSTKPGDVTEPSSKLSEPSSEKNDITEPSTKPIDVTEPSTKQSDVTVTSIKYTDITEPSSNPSDVTEPILKSSVITESSSKSTDVTEPSTKTTDVTEPSTKSSDVTEPSTKSSDVTEPSTKSSDVTDPSTKSSDVTEPSTKSSDVTEPSTKSSDVTGPSTKSRDATEPSTKSSDVTEPSTELSDVTELTTKSSDVTELATKSSDLTEPTMRTTDVTKPSEPVSSSSETETSSSSAENTTPSIILSEPADKKNNVSEDLKTTKQSTESPIKLTDATTKSTTTSVPAEKPPVETENPSDTTETTVVLDTTQTSLKVTSIDDKKVTPEISNLITETPTTSNENTEPSDKSEIPSITTEDFKSEKSTLSSLETTPFSETSDDVTKAIKESSDKTTIITDITTIYPSKDITTSVTIDELDLKSGNSTKTPNEASEKPAEDETTTNDTTEPNQKITKEEPTSEAYLEPTISPLDQETFSKSPVESSSIEIEVPNTTTEASDSYPTTSPGYDFEYASTSEPEEPKDYPEEEEATTPPVPEIPQLTIGEEEEGNLVTTTPNKTVIQLLETPGLIINHKPVTFKVVLKLFDAAGLTNLLNRKIPYTFCVPHDGAFARMPQATMDYLQNDLQRLRRVLLYHMISTRVPMSNLYQNNIVRTYQGSPVIINVQRGGKLVIIGGSEVIGMHQMPYGQVYVINRPLSRLPEENLLKALSQRPNLSSFNNYIRGCPLSQTLKGKGPYTIFAPTNNAFKNLPKKIADAIRNDKSALERLLNNHVVTRAQFSQGATREVFLPTIGGERLRFKLKGSSVTVNGIRVQHSDIPTGNGVIHIIDRILIPRTDITVQQNEPIEYPLERMADGLNIDTFIKWLKQSGLMSRLHNGEPYTIFAPTETAIRSLPPTLLRAMQSNVNQLLPIVKYHLMPSQIQLDRVTNEMVLQTAMPNKPARFNVYHNNTLVTVAGAPIVSTRSLNGLTLAVVNRVLYPPIGDVYLTVSKSPLLQDLTQAIKTAGLEEELTGSGPFTFFAPTEAAFRYLPKGEFLELFNDPDKLRDLVLRHIMYDSTTFSAGVNDGMLARSANGAEIKLTLRPHCLVVNGVNVIYSDITATNGVVHVIDHLL